MLRKRTFFTPARPGILRKALCFLILLGSLSATGLKGQDESGTPVDSLFRKIMSPFRSLDLQHLNTDSAVWLSQSVRLDSADSEPVLISRLQKLASHYRVTRQVAEHFIRPQTIQDEVPEMPRQNDLVRYRGKKIRDILILKTDILYRFSDTSDVSLLKRASALLEHLHHYTREDVIRKNLIIREGGMLNPALILENERLIRSLPYIDECRFLVSPASEEDWVDVLIIVQDRLSYTGEIRFNSSRQALLSLNFLNIYGSGTALNEEVKLETDQIQKSAISHSQVRLDNIGGSFVNGGFISHEDELKNYRIFSLDRYMRSDIFTYTGEVNLGRFRVTDSLGQPAPYYYNDYDVWLGRSLNFRDDEAMLSHPKVLLSTRVYRRVLNSSPYSVALTPLAYQPETDVLLNLAVSRRHFYYTTLVHDLGKTEDLPAGYLVNITGGRRYKFGDPFDYAGIQASGGAYHHHIGYVYQRVEYSTWFDGSAAVNGSLNCEFLQFTPIFAVHGLPGRFFSRVSYTRGIHRKDDARLILFDELLPGTFEKKVRTGTKRLLVGVENVLYTRQPRGGIRSAWYLHGDMGLLADESEELLRQKVVWGLGTGYRIKHDYLAFNTLQAGIVLYWSEAGRAPVMGYQLSANRSIRFDDFIQNKPAFSIFR